MEIMAYMLRQLCRRKTGGHSAGRVPGSHQSQVFFIKSALQHCRQMTENPKALDKERVMYIIMFTHPLAFPWRWSMPKSQRLPRKRDVLRQQGTLNPRPQDVTHPLFQQSAFFDPPGLTAGQVRDVAPSTRREPDRPPSGPGLWFLPPFLLSGPSGLRARRPARVAAPEARTAARAQVDGSGDEISDPSARRRAVVVGAGAGRASHEALRPQSSSAHHRAPAAASGKKTTPAILTLSCSPPPGPVRAWWKATRHCASTPWAQGPRIREGGAWPY